jgi:hypothetical protein
MRRSAHSVLTAFNKQSGIPEQIVEWNARGGNHYVIADRNRRPFIDRDMGEEDERLARLGTALLADRIRLQV